MTLPEELEKETLAPLPQSEKFSGLLNMFLRKLHQNIKMQRKIYFAGKMNADIKDGSPELVDFSDGLDEEVLRFLRTAMREGALFARKYVHRHKGEMWFVLFSADLPKYMVHCFPFLTEAVQGHLLTILHAFTKVYGVELPEQVKEEEKGKGEEILWRYKGKEFRFGRRIIQVAQISEREKNPSGFPKLSDRSRRSLAYGDF